MKRKIRFPLFQQFLSQMPNVNRNNNACTNDQDTQSSSSPPQLYAHFRKIYNNDTDLLEYARIIMSTIKPEENETIRQRRARVSKQRAKILISEYCTRKIPENVTNKRNHSSFCLSSLR